MIEITIPQVRKLIEKAEREIAEIVTELESRAGLPVVGMTFSPEESENVTPQGAPRPAFVVTKSCMIDIKVEL